MPMATLFFRIFFPGHGQHGARHGHRIRLLPVRYERAEKDPDTRKGMELQLGTNATNVLNTPQFSPPPAANMSIDATAFGRIITTVIPNRVVVLPGRICC